MLLYVLTLLSAVQCCWCCSMPNDWRSLEIEEGLALSDIVVYGENVKHSEQENMGGGQLIIIDSYVSVHCVLKNKGLAVPANITLKRLVYVTPCTDLSYVYNVGKMYLLGLRRVNESSTAPDFRVLNFVFGQDVIFSATPTNLRRVANLCGLENRVTPADSNLTVSSCPKRTVPDSGCATGIPPDPNTPDGTDVPPNKPPHIGLFPPFDVPNTPPHPSQVRENTTTERATLKTTRATEVGKTTANEAPPKAIPTEELRENEPTPGLNTIEIDTKIDDSTPVVGESRSDTGSSSTVASSLLVLSVTLLLAALW